MEEFWIKLQSMKESLSFHAPPDVIDMVKTIEDHWRPICEPAKTRRCATKMLKTPRKKNNSNSPVTPKNRRSRSSHRENVENELHDCLPTRNAPKRRRSCSNLNVIDHQGVSFNDSVTSSKSFTGNKSLITDEPRQLRSRSRSIMRSPERKQDAAVAKSDLRTSLRLASKSPLKSKSDIEGNIISLTSRSRTTSESSYKAKSLTKTKTKSETISKKLSESVIKNNESKKTTPKSRRASESTRNSKSPVKTTDKSEVVELKSATKSKTASGLFRKTRSPTRKEKNTTTTELKKTSRSKTTSLLPQEFKSPVEEVDKRTAETKTKNSRSRTIKKEKPVADSNSKKIVTRSRSSSSTSSDKFKSAINKDEKLTIEKPKKSSTVSLPTYKVDKLNKSKALNDTVLKLDKNNIEKKNKKGETALHLACIKNNMEKVTELLSLGANPNTKDHAGWTPLHEVVNKRYIEIAKLLLEHGASPNVPGPMNETVLHDVVKSNQIEICIMLMEKGANIHAKNSKGVTPLDLANVAMKEILLSTTPKSEVKDLLLPSILNVKLNFEFHIFPSFLKPKNKSLLQNLIKQHNNIIIDKIITKDTSILIVESHDENHCPTDINTLNAVVIGIPIIRSEWLSLNDDSHLALLKDFELSYIGGYREAITLSYRNRLNLMPPLFDGCHFHFLGLKKFYDVSATLIVNVDLLNKIIIDGGGKLLRREPDAELISENEQLLPYHAKENSTLSKCSHYILYGKKPEMCYNMLHIKSLPITWLIECIQSFTLIDTDHFFL